MEDHFSSSALISAIKKSGGTGTIGGMSVSKMLSDAGIDLNKLAKEAQDKARAQALAQYGASADSPEGQAIAASIKVTPRDVLNNMDTHSVAVTSGDLGIDYQDVDVSDLVRQGILTSSKVDLTDCGLGVIDLATFNADNITEDDLDISAIDFSGVSQKDAALGLAAYAVVAFLHMRRIKKVPLALALKAQE